MKRRDFIKTGICLGCAGVVGAGFCIKKKPAKIYTANEIAEMSKQFIYKSVEELPKKVRIDICNKCQLNCVACWMRLDEERIIKEGDGFGYVSFKSFKHFVDNHPFITDIEMSHGGEIFLNPELEEILKYAHKKNIKLTADNGVNLNSLSERMAEALVKYQVRLLVVSMDAATPETYSIYRRGGNFNTVISNIKKINKYKEKYNSEFPRMTYKFILFGHNEHEILAAKQLAKDLNMDIHFAQNCVKGYSPVKNKRKVMKETGLTDIGLDHVINLNLYNNKLSDLYPCTALYDSPQINFNGNLFGCCHNYLESYHINVFKDGLFKALNNEKVLYTKLILSNLDIKPRQDIPCLNCYLYDYIKSQNSPIVYRNSKRGINEKT